MNVIKQKKQIEAAGKILDMISRERDHITALERDIDQKEELQFELYKGQLQRMKYNLDIKYRASKRLKESFKRIIKEIHNDKA